MSWIALIATCAGCYGLKAIGPLVLSGRSLPPALERLAGLVAVPVLAALVALQTVGQDRELVLDARLPALGVAALLVWRKASFLLVVLAAAATAAALRAVS